MSDDDHDDQADGTTATATEPDQADSDRADSDRADSDDAEGSGDSGDSDDGAQLTKEQAMGTEDVPEDKVEAIEAEREERLDPDNRPENSEVDNSERDFDVASGQFTDHDKDEEIGPYNDPNAEDGESEA